MSERLWAALNGSEPQTGAALINAGYAVQSYGQSMLTETAREMLRGVPTPQRWTPDFLVSRAAVTDRPTWPRSLRPKFTLLVDAKWSPPSTGNHSIEMRSLLAASTFGLDVFYVCSHRYGDQYRDFGVIHHEQVMRGRHRPCCSSCHRLLTGPGDPMRELPEYCPSQPRNSTSSGTPFVVLAAAELTPLTDDVFDRLSPRQLAKFGWPYGLRAKK